MNRPAIFQLKQHIARPINRPAILKLKQHLDCSLSILTEKIRRQTNSPNEHLKNIQNKFTQRSNFDELVNKCYDFEGN